MDEGTLGVISKVFQEVLERQAFMFADPADRSSLAAHERDFLAASIGFRGDIEGRITLAVPWPMAEEIAANILGTELSDPMVPARSRDACKELLNVVCGHILTALRGEKPVFDLSIPEVDGVTAAIVAGWAGMPGSLVFAVEGEPVLLMAAFGPESSAGATA